MSIFASFIRWTEKLSGANRECSEAQAIGRRQALGSVMMAFLGYHAPYSLALLAFLMGYQPFGLKPLIYLYLYTLGITFVIYVLILRVRRVSHRFLYWQTILQLAAWLLMFALYTLLMAEYRAVALIFALMTYAFVSLIGSLKEALILCLSVVVSYLVTMAMANNLIGQPIDLISEFLFLGAFVMVSLYLTFMGRSMRLSRDRARHVKLHLQKTQTELSSVMSQLERRARTDELTGLDNRRYGREILSKMQQALDASSSSAMIMLLDIDNFKMINDRYGHDTGDIVLKAVARTLTSLKRDDDLLVRWGGVEFLVAWPDTTLEAAIAVSERLRQAIAELEIEVNSTPIRVTFSAGLAELKSGESLNETVKTADKWLYAAKGSGRNRVCYQADVF